MMKGPILAACAAVALLSGGVLAQAAPPTAIPQAVPADAIDPARIEAARRLIDVVMPPESRERMIRATLEAMMGTVRKLMSENPKFSTDASTKEISARFMKRMQEAMIEDMAADLPAMANAMTRAYARRFSVEEMQQAEAFFASPAGKAFAARGPAVLSDPDVVDWQRGLMQRQMARMPAMMDAMTRELEAATRGKGKPRSKSGG